MSIEVRCPGCGRTYRTGEQFAGRQVKCKACGSGMTVPTPVPVAALDDAIPFDVAPPPLPSAYRPAVPLANPYAPVVLPPTPPPSRNTAIVIACVVGGVVLLLVLGGWAVYSAVQRLGGPAMSMSDASLSSRLVGVWSGTQSHPGQASGWGELTFNADGTGRMRFSGQGKVADADITWQVRNHMIQLTFAKMHVGNRASVGTSFLLGRVKAVSSSQLVMATQYGDESYTPSLQPGGQPPAGFPRFPVLGMSAYAAGPSPPVSPFGGAVPRVPNSPRASTAAASAPPVTPAGPWQDLLANLNTGSATVAGEWKLTDGTLTGTSPHGFGRLTLGRPPAPSFELQLTFSRTAGSREFSVLVPAGKTPAELQVGAFNGQLTLLRGGPTARYIRNTIVNGSDQTLDVTVRPQGTDITIRVTLDEKPVITWTGPAFRLRIGNDLPTANPAMLGLAVHDGVTVQFKSARVRPLRDR